jgi:hypothetical protein
MRTRCDFGGQIQSGQALVGTPRRALTDREVTVRR